MTVRSQTTTAIVTPAAISTAITARVKHIHNNDEPNKKTELN